MKQHLDFLLTTSNEHDWSTIYRLLPHQSPEDWRNPPGFLGATWLKTVHDDLKLDKLTVTELIDMAQNWPLWRLLARHSALAVFSRNDKVYSPNDSS